ncbi:MAG: hypothetical protein FJZ90_07565 [Chloroflexi bacterium]|nr:hypothetical protein [Chloroflexota bacterium]
MTVLAYAPDASMSTERALRAERWCLGHSDTTSGQVLYALHPQKKEFVRIDPSQAWFWTPEWQAGESAVDADLAEGRYEEYGSIAEFLAAL